jgi:hypothetical protein
VKTPEENTMRKVAFMLLGAATFAAASIDLAAAADGCGRGRYWNGYRCVGQVYRGPAYYRSYARPIRPVGSVGCDAYGRCYRTAPHSCSHPGFTIQDGVCKPYRGY